MGKDEGEINSKKGYYNGTERIQSSLPEGRLSMRSSSQIDRPGHGRSISKYHYFHEYHSP